MELMRGKERIILAAAAKILTVSSMPERSFSCGARNRRKGKGEGWSEEPSPHGGILPITETKFRARDWVNRDDYRYRFLAGNDHSKATCGVWMMLGCLEHDDHAKFPLSSGQLNLEGVEVRKVHAVEMYKASCGRLGCPVCYEKACAKEAIKIAHRIGSFRIKGRDLKPIHVSVSPSEKDVAVLDFLELRRKAYEVAEKCGVFGGSVIFHPFRKFNEDDSEEDLEEGFSHKTAPACWYISPHFHVIGYGWVKHAKKNYEESGWVVKNHGIRKDVRATAHYQLSHCGVNPKYHTVVWFGALAYNKMRCVPLPPEEHPCPICSAEMRKVRFIDGADDAIVKSSLTELDAPEGFYFVDAGILEYVEDKRWSYG